ncbi:MAG: TetR/AcrR family transcriptional regulator [Acidobacteriota bacterium]
MARRSTTRDRLVSTATDLFSRQGYGQTGVNEIMQLARATSGSFYHFFPAKEDLAVAVLDQAAEDLEAEVFDPAEETAQNPIEGIFVVFDHYRRRLVASDFALGSPAGCLAAELSETHPQVRAKASQFFDITITRIESFLDEAADSLAPGVDRRELAELMACTLEGALVLARAHHSAAALESAIAGLRRYLELLQRAGSEAEEAAAPMRPAPSRPRQSADWRSW